MDKLLQILGLITVGLNVLIAVFVFIPGEQPEAFLKKVVALIEGISRK